MVGAGNGERTVSDVSLQNNRVGEDGARELAFVLRDNRTFTSLDLRVCSCSAVKNTSLTNSCVRKVASGLVEGWPLRWQ